MQLKSPPNTRQPELDSYLLNLYHQLINFPSIEVPSTSTSPGIKGTVSYDTNYIYLCTTTNTWARIAYTDTTF